jgi:hypothetical protein
MIGVVSGIARKGEQSCCVRDGSAVLEERDGRCASYIPLHDVKQGTGTAFVGLNGRVESGAMKIDHGSGDQK